MKKSTTLRAKKLKWKQLSFVPNNMDLFKQSHFSAGETGHMKGTYICCCYDYKLIQYNIDIKTC